MDSVSVLKSDGYAPPCLGDAALQVMLAEDVPYGDLTTRALGIGLQPARMVFRARRAMCVCGSEEAARLIELAGAAVSDVLPSGTQVTEDALLLQATGNLAALQTAWKTAQTLTEYLSGMASAAAAIVQILREGGFDLPLACTRKNFPGNRTIAAKAVVAGGAIAHRLGLSETVLVFPDHRVFVDKAALPDLFARIRRQLPEKKLVAEASDPADALWLAACGADVLQLERFTPEQLAACKASLVERHPRVLVAPAGGVTCANALAYARAGADFLVSSAPYFALPCDVAVSFSSL